MDRRLYRQLYRQLTRRRPALLCLVVTLSVGVPVWAAEAPPTPPFLDVTATVGLDFVHDNGMTGKLYFAEVMGAGVALFDFDNDGDLDLYFPQGHLLAEPLPQNLASDRLYRNDSAPDPAPNFRFVDVTAKAGLAPGGYGMGVASGDFDNDGWVDLYVTNYGENQLLRNRGDGTFEEVSAQALRNRQKTTTLGTVAADFNGDGWLDLYVANDMMANQLWLNQKDGTFLDEAMLGGCAVSGEGLAQASMGVVAEDFDLDSDFDLFMTHLTQEHNTHYQNEGQGFFRDTSVATGLGNPSWEQTGFGIAALDFDNDGDLDLLVANGAIKHKQELLRLRDPYPLHERNQLFLNRGNGRFDEVTATAGPAFERSEVSRGVASGDLDQDGDVDVVIANNHGPARVLLNQVGSRAPWLGLRLLESHGRDALGAQVTVVRQNGPPLVRRVASDGSYGSAKDPRLTIGLGFGPGGPGTDPTVLRLQVDWPGGQSEVWDAPRLRQYTVLRQGSGRPLLAQPSGGAHP